MHAYVYILCVCMCVCICTYTHTKVLIDILTYPELQVLIRPSSLKFGEKRIDYKKQINSLVRKIWHLHFCKI